MKRACVIGWPVSHSRSPLIHNYWLKCYGIEGIYTREPVPPAELDSFIRSLAANGFEGCNVTIPHKEACFTLVEPADQATERLKVVNTVFRRDGRLLGTSTDGEGFMASLLAAVPDYAPQSGAAEVLGAGGAAMAIVGALLDKGVPEIRIANRTHERAVHLARQFGKQVRSVAWDKAAEAAAECSLLVNTTALGMSGQPDLQFDFAHLPSHAAVCDIVYVPLETKLLREARLKGYRTVGGLGMLLHQAVRGFELWFGVRPEVTQELYGLVTADVLGASAR